MPQWAVLCETWIQDEARKRLAKACCVATPKWDSRDDLANMHLLLKSRHDFDFEAFIPASVISNVT